MDELKRGLRDLKQNVEQAVADAQAADDESNVNVARRSNIVVAGNTGGDGSHAASSKQVTRIRQRNGETEEETVETRWQSELPG